MDMTTAVETPSTPFGIITPFTALAPGHRHTVRGRSRDYVLRILPFGPGNRYAHALFHEPDGLVLDSVLLLPDQIQEMARDGFPLGHLEPGTSLGVRSRAGAATPEEIRKLIREDGKQEPAESNPDETDPEAVQSPAEGEVFNRLRSKELVEATLGKVFGDGGPQFKPGSLLDTTFMDDDVSLPVREVIHHVTPDGRPIWVSTTTFRYNAEKMPTMIFTLAIKGLEVNHYRKVLVEETLKSSSLSAGLTLALTAPTQTQTVSSGPRRGDNVHTRGSATGIGFDFSVVKTWSRLRIEAELKMGEKSGGTEHIFTRIPPIGS